MSAFEELGVCPELIKAVEELGWLLPTPVQAEAVPLILGGGDVMAAAETGSGKTGAFALPVLQIVHEALRRALAGGAAGGQPTSAGGKANGSGTGTGQPSGASPLTPCVMSTQDRDAVMAVAPDGLAVQSRSDKSWGGGRATLGAFAGKVYFEMCVTDEGLARVGWSTSAASLDLGTDRQGWGFGGTGKKSHNRQFDSYGTAYGLNDVVGCCFDADTGSVSYTLNGKELGEAAVVPEGLRGQMLYPALCLKNAEVRLNFGAAPWTFTPPPGYVGIGVAGPACVAPAAAVAGDSRGGFSSSKAGSQRSGPLCIILEPSRDLAEQTAIAIASFAKHLANPRVRCALLVGGMDAGPQLKALREGVEVVVATPGRIIDFVESGKLGLDAVKFFVLDEADRLVADAPEVVQGLYKRLPKGGTGLNRLQVLLFSATLHSPEVQSLAASICQDPTLVDLKGREYVPETVDHVVLMVDPREDRSWVQGGTPPVPTDAVHTLDKVGPGVTSRECDSEAVKRLKPRLLQRIIDTFKMDQALIFVRTNFDADNLEAYLHALSGGGAEKPAGFRGKAESGKEGAYSCVVLGGARSMEERRRALAAFKEGDVRFLIATDVGARGLDIKELPYVINMTLPDKSEDYIHRVGRVGRADTMGLAISLVSAVHEKVWYCTQKGYKPWLEPDAKNTRTNEQGGHTIWYDEIALLRTVEARLGRPVARLAPDLSLPPDMVARLAGSGDKYGQARGGGTCKEVAEHLAAIHQNVRALGSLETAAQGSFLSLKTRWTRPGAAAGRAGVPSGTSAGGRLAKHVKA